MRFTVADTRHRRLARHGLTEPLADTSPVGAARAMHGVHAQVSSAAELSVALRLPGTTRQQVRDALADHQLTRTFGPRGTNHLLPTADLPLWLPALGAVPRTSSFHPSVSLDDDQTDAVVAAVDAALREAELTLAELDEQVARRAGAWAGERVMPAFGELWPRWRQALDVAACRGALVFGAGRGRAVTYARPAPGFAVVDVDVALRWFLLGYLRAFGPATPEHLARWLSTDLAWAQRVFATYEDDLVSVRTPAGPAWLPADDLATATRRRSVRLLPYFDALAVGYQPRDDLYVGRAAERALTRRQAGNLPVLLVDGVVTGVWHHRRAGRRVAVTVETWTDLTTTRRRALAEQVERVGEILEATSTLTLGAVTVGPHA